MPLPSLSKTRKEGHNGYCGFAAPANGAKDRRAAERSGTAAHCLYAVHHCGPLRGAERRRGVRYLDPCTVFCPVGGRFPHRMQHFCHDRRLVPVRTTLSHPAGAQPVAQPLAVHGAADGTVLLCAGQRCRARHAALGDVPGQHQTALVCGGLRGVAAACPGAQPGAAHSPPSDAAGPAGGVRRAAGGVFHSLCRGRRFLRCALDLCI